MFNVLSADAECDMYVEEFLYLSVEAERASAARRHGRARRLGRRLDLLADEVQQHGREFAQRFRARLEFLTVHAH